MAGRVNTYEAMEAAGWRYDHHSNSFRNADGLWVSFLQAEQALIDAKAGIDRSAPVNDNAPPLVPAA